MPDTLGKSVAIILRLFDIHDFSTVSSPSERQRPRKSRKAVTVSTGQVRVIAGQWRGRKLPVLSAPGLRPTGDRVRETLFNWLQADIAGSRCLDLFAGTGALGLEALSRYAQVAVFVEPDAATRGSLLQSCGTLGLQPALMGGTDNPADSHQIDVPATVFAGTATDFLAQNDKQFDVVFIDPPFDSQLQWDMLEQLVPIHLSNSALIYIESPSNWSLPAQLPQGCCVHREKQFGDVHVRLLRYSTV